MSNLNITPEQIQEAINAMSDGVLNEEPVNPVYTVIEAAAAEENVRNVIKTNGGELRCIISNNGEIKPTKLEDGATTQVFEPENGDVIAWITIVNNDRQILQQDKDGISPIGIDKLNTFFGDKTGYALSYLSSFGGDNNILLDEEKVKRYEEATIYAENFIGDSDHGLKTLIASMCTNTDNFKDICQTWDEAEVYDATDEENPITIEWGCTAKTESDYTEFTTSYAILWAKPMVLNPDGEEVPDSLVQVVTRQVNPDNVPRLGTDSKATFLVEEHINDSILAYAIVKEDTLNRAMKSITLFKTKDFDITKSSF